MTYATADRACIKMAESRNRLRSAVDALKKDMRYDLDTSRDRLVRYSADVQHKGRDRIAGKPLVSTALALAMGFLVGKWALSRLRFRQFEENMQTRSCSGI